MSLCANGCTTVPEYRAYTPAETMQELRVHEEGYRTDMKIAQFYRWLLQTGQLVVRVRPPGTEQESRELDPETREPVLVPAPTAEELIKRFNELMKDPPFREECEKSDAIRGS